MIQSEHSHKKKRLFSSNIIIYKMLRFFKKVHVILLASLILDTHEDCGTTRGEITSSFPWNVGIYSENKNQLELTCFGSVIQSNAILTAAHCFSNETSKIIHNTNFYVTKNILKKSVDKRQETPDFQKIDKDQIILNKYYGGLYRFLLNDLAIIKIKFAEDTVPVCVAWSDEVDEETPYEKEPIFDNSKLKITDQTYLTVDECKSSAPKSFVPFINAGDKKCTITKDAKAYFDHVSEGGGLFFYDLGTQKWYIKGVTSKHELTEGKLSTYSSIKQNLNWMSNVCATLSF